MAKQMIKLICSRCNSEVNKFSVICKDLVIRNDFDIEVSIAKLKSEYYGGKISSVIFNCSNCGDIIVSKKSCEDIGDFVSYNDEFLKEQLKKSNYGPIKVVKY